MGPGWPRNLYGVVANLWDHEKHIYTQLAIIQMWHPLGIKK